MMGSMAINNTPEAIESVMDEEDLMRIHEKFNILVSIKLELPSPFERETTRSMTWVKL